MRTISRGLFLVALAVSGLGCTAQVGLPSTGSTSAGDAASGTSSGSGTTGPASSGGAASSSGSTAGSSGTSGSAERIGELEITSPLVLSPTAIHVGESVSARAVLHNPAATAISVDSIVISYFPPGGTQAAGPWGQLVVSGPMSLPADGDYLISGARAFSSGEPLGTYNAYVTYQDLSGAWHDSSVDVPFTVSAAPIRDAGPDFDAGGTGLMGAYYSDTHFWTLAHARVDATVDFDWDGGSPPAPGLLVKKFSVRWKGQVLPRFSESYTFHTQSEGGVRLWVAGTQIIDDWTADGGVDHRATITLDAGTKYDLELEYFASSRPAVAALSWSSPSLAEEIIPTHRLFPAAAPTASYLRGIGDEDFSFSSLQNANYGPVAESVVSLRFLANRGHRIIRLPLFWGPTSWSTPPTSLQLSLQAPLDPHFLAQLHQEVDNVRAAGMAAILEVQGGCRYPNDHSTAVCGNGVTQADVNDLWLKLSNEFKDDPGVYAYDMMNEPHDMDAAVWEQYAQGMVDTIRANGDDTLIWMEGVNWSNPYSWSTTNGPPWIQDPANNILYEAHTYPPTSNGGTWTVDAGYFPSDEVWLNQLQEFTSWCATYQVHCGIGEVSWPSSDTSADWQQWNDLGERWYQAADAANLTVTFFDASTFIAPDPVGAYDHAAGNGFIKTPPSTLTLLDFDSALSQAPVIEAHPSRE